MQPAKPAVIMVSRIFGNHTWIPTVVYPLEGGGGGMTLLLDLCIIRKHHLLHFQLEVSPEACIKKSPALWDHNTFIIGA